MEKGQLAGAVSSCVKKGFVIVEEGEEDKTIAITQLGFDTLNA
jgi:predicted transcriptional regulator